jgi:hypothetical protein
MSLNDKISQVKDEHAAEIVDQRQAARDEKAKLEALFFLGRVRQIDHDARSIATALSAQAIRAIEHFSDQRTYKVLGYQTLVDFLDKSEFSPMSKHQYYERLKLINEHGDEIYDLLTSVGISVRAQKLLGSGELAIQGDKLMIGDTEVDVANTGVIKDVLNELFDEKRELTKKLEKAKSTIDDQRSTIEKGTEEFQELQRALDESESGDPFDRALAHTIHAHLLLAEQVGHLSDKQKTARGNETLRTLYDQFKSLRLSFGSNFDLEDDQPSTAQPAKSEISDLTARVLAEDSDFGDEEEK